MVVVNSKALLPFLPVPPLPPPPPPPPPGNTLLTNRSPGKFCFSKGHYLSSSEQLAGCTGTKFQGMIPHIKQTPEAPPPAPFFILSHYFLFNGCSRTACLTAAPHPGSPAEEDQYLNCAVVGQHVRLYKIKWGLKLIPSSP